MTAAIASADGFHTPSSRTRISPRPTQTTALTARRPTGGSESHRSRVRPRAPSACHQPAEIAARMRRPTSGPFRCSLAEEALGAEDEDEDEDPEHDRLRPVAAGRFPDEPLVEGLDEADEHGPEDGAREVADASEHSGRERDQAEL